MFYYLLINITIDYTDLKSYIYDSIDVVDGFENGEKFSYVTNDFVLDVRKENKVLSFKNQEYDTNFNFLLLFEIYSNSNWATKMMELTGKLLNHTSGDCLIESNGDTPILFRKDDCIIVDDSKLHGTAKFPFEVLNHEYHYGSLNYPVL